jgi:hypothetical protein
MASSDHKGTEGDLIPVGQIRENLRTAFYDDVVGACWNLGPLFLSEKSGPFISLPWDGSQ